jgi:hypothetical protein
MAGVAAVEPAECAIAPRRTGMTAAKYWER